MSSATSAVVSLVEGVGSVGSTGSVGVVVLDEVEDCGPGGSMALATIVWIAS